MSKILQRTQRSAVGSKTEASILEVFSQITEIGQSLNLTKSLVDGAKSFFVWLNGLRREKKYDLKYPKDGPALSACCIYHASKLPGETQRNLKELAIVIQSPKKALTNNIKLLFLIISAQNRDPLALGPFSSQPSRSDGQENKAAKELLPRYCQVLGLSPKLENCARECIEKCSKVEGGHKIDGRSPISIAAGAIWFSSQLFGIYVSSKDIMEVAQVSESTIRL